jgi:hypothetical protein
MSLLEYVCNILSSSGKALARGFRFCDRRQRSAMQIRGTPVQYQELQTYAKGATTKRNVTPGRRVERSHDVRLI